MTSELDRFSLLFVCAGNVCRSPMTEYMLKREFFGLATMSVSSAGTQALVGSPMDEKTTGIASTLGLRGMNNHRARQLTEAMLASSDLVIAMTRQQRREAVEYYPRITRKVFTLREFARLAEAGKAQGQNLESTEVAVSPPARLREAVKEIPQYRSLLLPLEDPQDDDVVDPYRQDDDLYVQSTNQIAPAVEVLAAWLRRNERSSRGSS